MKSRSAGRMRSRWTRASAPAALAVLALLVGAGAPQVRGAQSSTTIDNMNITQPWLDKQLTAWAPTSIQRMSFGATLQSISYSNVASTTGTPTIFNADLQMLEATGASLIRVDLGYDAWLSGDTATQQRVDTYFHAINASGKLVVIADSSAERYRSGPLTWSNFQTQWVQRVSTLAARYHPYAYVVVKEPGWYYPMISDASYNYLVYDPNAWGNLTSSLADAVKKASPTTLVGAAVAAYDLYNNSAYQGKVSFAVQYMQRMEKLSNVDFLGYDIYDIPGFLGTQRFLSQPGNNAKPVWIAEAWSADGSFITDGTRSALDAEWVKVLYYFCQLIHAQAVLPFYTDLFAAYGPEPTDANGLYQFYQQRTPVFTAYQQIISSNLGGSSSTTSTTSTTSTSTTSSTTSTSTSTSTSSSSPSTSTQSKTSSSRPSSSSSQISTASSTSSSSQSSSPQTTSIATQAQQGSSLVGPIVGVLLLGLFLVVGSLIFLRRRRK